MSTDDLQTSGDENPYPVRYFAEWRQQRSRLTTFFRLLLALPPLVTSLLFAIAAIVTVPLAWFALLFTARYPAGLYAFNSRVLRQNSLAWAYLNLSMEPFPDLVGRDDPEAQARVTVGPAQERYNRWLVLFRFVFFLPVYLVIYAAMGSCVVYGSVMSWFMIVFVGRQAKGLQDIIDLGLNYETRARAYLMLLTDRFPPFADGASGFAPKANQPAVGAAPTAPAVPVLATSAEPAELPGGFTPPQPPR